MASKEDNTGTNFPLGRENFILLSVGFAVIVLGFVLMLGGKSSDPNIFNEDIFSFRRIVLAPVLVILGFVFEIYAIMKRPKDRHDKK